MTGTARPASDFKVQQDGVEIPILEADLVASQLDRDFDDPNKREYLVPVSWIRTLPGEQAFWEPRLFANQNTAARLRGAETIARLEEHFGIGEDETGPRDANRATHPRP